jgi:hypothetical protein
VRNKRSDGDQQAYPFGLSCVTELQPVGEHFVDYGRDGGSYHGGCYPGCHSSNEVCVSVYLVRKADCRILSLNNSDCGGLLP